MPSISEKMEILVTPQCWFKSLFHASSAALTDAENANHGDDSCFILAGYWKGRLSCLRRSGQRGSAAQSSPSPDPGREPKHTAEVLEQRQTMEPFSETAKPCNTKSELSIWRRRRCISAIMWDQESGCNLHLCACESVWECTLEGQRIKWTHNSSYDDDEDESDRWHYPVFFPACV